MSHSLNSLVHGVLWGTTIGVIKGDTRSLDMAHMEAYRDPRHIYIYTCHMCVMEASVHVETSGLGSPAVS